MTSKLAIYSNIRNVGGFLSDYFLGNILNEKSLKGKLGENEVNSAYKSFLNLFRKRQYELGDNTSQDELYRRWIKPILQRLVLNLRGRLTLRVIKETSRYRQ